MFKECTSCHHVWEDRDDFLSDPAVVLVGYQVNFERLKEGLFLFNHELKTCGTSMAIAAGEFTDMHDGPIFSDIPHDTVENCPGYCEERSYLDPCNEKCECAYVRDVLDKVNKWPKR